MRDLDRARAFNATLPLRLADEVVPSRFGRACFVR
jgi:hypothetical protein